MNQEDLNKLLNLHELYLKHKAKGKCLELVNEDLSNLIFSNRDLSGSKFINCNFECAKLKNIILHYSDIEQCKFTNAVLENVLLNTSNLLDVSFAKARGKNIDFSNSTLLNINFEGTKFKNIYMDFTISEQVHMQKSHWNNLSNLTIYV